MTGGRIFGEKIRGGERGPDRDLRVIDDAEQGILN